MTNKQRIFAIAGSIAAMLMLALTGVALASSVFSATVQTSTATSTPAFMTPGTATSTLVYNTLTDNSNATGTPTGTKFAKADKITLAVQFQGSSTVAVLKLAYEYSSDGIDWYQNFLPQHGFSTTTQALLFTQSDSVTVPFASTSYNGVASKSNTDNFLIEVPAPSKDVRIVASMTGANGAVWMQVVPTKTQ